MHKVLVPALAEDDVSAKRLCFDTSMCMCVYVCIHACMHAMHVCMCLPPTPFRLILSLSLSLHIELAEVRRRSEIPV
jgi:hypothetical protein